MTSALLATTPALDGIGGRYVEHCHQAEVVAQISDGISGVRGYALDAAAAHRLWEVFQELLETAAKPADPPPGQLGGVLGC